MGVVYQAEHAELGRQVALKVLIGQDPKRFRRFEREASLAAQIEHPHLVRVFEAGLHEGHPWLAMEFVAGESLAERLTRGPLDPAEACRLFAGLADALAKAHAAQIVHRDVKAGNVLLGADGRARLADFGLARGLADERERLTVTGHMVGTPATMAPEQVAGLKEGVGPPADVWGLGATLYEALTGQIPFRGEGLIQLLAMISAGEPEPPRALRRQIPPALEELVLSCLTKDPRQRPSAAELASALRQLTGERAAGPPRPKPLLLAPLLALGLAAGLGLPALLAPTAADPLAAGPSPAETLTPSPASSPEDAPAPAAQAAPVGEWAQVESSPHPPPREGIAHGLASDLRGRRAFLFGGRDGERLFRDLWCFEPAGAGGGGAWRELETREAPSARLAHSLTYDPLRDVLVLFGGLRPARQPGGQSGVSADLWEFHLREGRWRLARLPPGQPAPSARAWHAAAWDAKAQQVVIFGGAAPARSRFQRLNDLWAWDGRAWTQASATGAPPPRQAFAMCGNPETRSVFVFGGVDQSRRELGDLWERRRDTWVRLRPPPQGAAGPGARRSAAMAAAPGGVLVFGGLRGRRDNLMDLWWWRGEERGWLELELEATQPPTRRFYGFAALSPSAEAWLMVNGKAAADRRALAETWRLSLRR